MKLPEKIKVTDQEIDLSVLTKVQQKYFIELAEHTKHKYLESGVVRYVVSISGPSGSGKSVLSVILEDLLQKEEGFTCHALDLDAFHFSKTKLAKNNLTEVKGRYDTYNIESMVGLLQSFKNNEEVLFPRYSRIDHEPHSGGSVVQPGNSILLLSGLWFQRDDEEWREVRRCVDYSISIEGDIDNFKQNTIDRHMRGSRTKTDAEEFYNNSDLKNTEEILRKSYSSDLILPYYENIQSEEDINFDSTRDTIKLNS